MEPSKFGLDFGPVVLCAAAPAHAIARIGIAKAAPNACLFGAGVSMAVGALHRLFTATDFFFTVT